MVINTNIEATRTANNLNDSQNNLAKSLSRLSSGERIVNPSDDAAGLAVSSRLNAQVSRLIAAQSNVVNAISFTQTQDGFMMTIDKAFRRMGELAMLARDATKSEADRLLYDHEFQQIMEYVNDSRTKEFNSVPLFDGAEIPVTIDTEGETFNMTGIDMNASNYTNALDDVGPPITGLDFDMSTNVITTSSNHGFSDGEILREPADYPLNPSFTIGDNYYIKVLSPTTFELYAEDQWDKEAAAPIPAGTPYNLQNPNTYWMRVYSDRIHIQTSDKASEALSLVTAATARVAQDRSALGAIQSRLEFTKDQLSTTKENLTSAISRIVDVDVAEEATKYARNQILVQSGAQMLTKANELPNIALKLLSG